MFLAAQGVVKGWFYVGETIGKIVSPVVLGLIFYGVLTPIAVIARVCGRDELRLKGTSEKSYWITRSETELTADSFNHPF